MNLSQTWKFVLGCRANWVLYPYIFLIFLFSRPRGMRQLFHFPVLPSVRTTLLFSSKRFFFVNCDSNSLKHDSMWFFFRRLFFFTLAFVCIYILYIVLHFLSKLLVLYRDLFCLTLSCNCTRVFCSVQLFSSVQFSSVQFCSVHFFLVQFSFLFSSIKAFFSLHIILHLYQGFLFHFILYCTCVKVFCPSHYSSLYFFTLSFTYIRVLFQYPFFITIVHYNISQ